jgi:hypothetical protein
MLPGACEQVEECRLAGVRITGQGNGYILFNVLFGDKINLSI